MTRALFGSASSMVMPRSANTLTASGIDLRRVDGDPGERARAAQPVDGGALQRRVRRRCACAKSLRRRSQRSKATASSCAPEKSASGERAVVEHDLRRGGEAEVRAVELAADEAHVAELRVGEHHSGDPAVAELDPAQRRLREHRARQLAVGQYDVGEREQLEAARRCTRLARARTPSPGSSWPCVALTGRRRRRAPRPMHRPPRPPRARSRAATEPDPASGDQQCAACRRAGTTGNLGRTRQNASRMSTTNTSESVPLMPALGVAGRAVAEGGRHDEQDLGADGLAHEGLVPALDDLPGADREVDGLPAVPRGVELLAASPRSRRCSAR